MAMVASALADKIRSDMGFPLPTSTQLTGWSQGVINAIIAGMVNHASGTITGTCPAAGGPLTNGAGTSGIISNIVAAFMASQVASIAGYGSVSSELQKFCDAISSHIMSGTVSFDSGMIVGTCGNLPPPPPPGLPGVLSAGAGTMGKIVGLDGTTLANTIHSSVGYPGGVSASLIKFCTAFTDYIMTNAEVTYSLGSVNGICPAGGGALTGGNAAGGVIS